MQAVIQRPRPLLGTETEGVPSCIAHTAFSIADAMLAERERVRD